MTESYTPPYQPKIEPEAIDLLTVQVEKLKQSREGYSNLEVGSV
jgi:hypothetical protein